MSDPFDEGQRAAMDAIHGGSVMADCPYAEDTFEASEWHHGVSVILFGDDYEWEGDEVEA